jgi:hypothetical protein
MGEKFQHQRDRLALGKFMIEFADALEKVAADPNVSEEDFDALKRVWHQKLHEAFGAPWEDADRCP